MQTRTGFTNFIPLVYLLPLIILIEGFASIAVEILTIRQLLPVAGGSVVVTSLIIGVFLLFLALGYDWGGRVQHKLEHVLRRNFLITSVLTGIGLSYFFVFAFFDLVHRVTTTHIMYPLMAYLLLVLAPIVFLLGQTLPITMNIVRQDKMAGAIAGKAMGLSTVGSFLGAIFTTIVLMHFFGVAVTVFVVFALLMLLSLLLSANVRDLIIKSVFAIFAAWIVYILNISIEDNLFVLTTTYGNYEIIDHTEQDGRRYLLINGSMSSMINEFENRGFEYVETIKKIIFDDMKLKNANILVLGAAGFTITQTSNNNFGNHFIYVDIESKLKEVVVPGFIKKIDDELVIDDARHYLNATNKKFEAIIVDVYSNRYVIPAHLVTREFMREIKAKLTSHGVAIFNIIANPMLTDTYSKRVDNTIRSVFGSCAATPVQYYNGLSNIIYACSNQSDQSETLVYTDNINNATVDVFDW